MKFAVLTHNFMTNKNDRKNAGVFVYDFVQALSKNRREKIPVLFYDFEGKQNYNTSRGITVFTPHGIKKKPGNWNKFSPLSLYYFFKTMRDAKKQTELFIKRKNISFILACWAIPSGLIAYHVKRHFRIPYAVWCLGSDINLFSRIPILKTMIVKSLREADVIFVNSDHLGKRIKNLTGLDAVFLPAVTEFSDKKTIHIKKRKKTYYLLYVGRLEKIKGIDLLIKSFTYININQYDIVLWIGGDGSLTGSIQKFINQTNLQDRVLLLGSLNQKMITAYMNSADLLIVPSRNESLPLVLIEAGKLGLPSIATDVGDSKRFIQQYSAGIITQPNNPHLLANGIKKGLDSLPRLTQLAISRKKRLNRLFTPEYTSKLFLQYAEKTT